VFGGNVNAVERAVKSRRVVRSVCPVNRLRVNETLRRGVVVNNSPGSRACVTLYQRPHRRKRFRQKYTKTQNVQ